MRDIYKPLTAGVKSYRWVIVGFWAAVTALNLYFAPKLMGATTSVFSSTLETPAKISKQEILKYFPDLSSSDIELVLVKSRDPNVILTEGPVADALYKFYTEYKREMKTEYSGIKDVVSYFTAMRDINPPIPWLANNLVNADKTSILILTFYNLNQFLQPTATFKFDAFIKKTVHRLLRENGLQDQVDANFVGSASFLNDITKTIKQDMQKIEFIVVPIALGILCYVVGSLPLMIIPLLSMPAVALSSFTFMYGVSFHMSILGAAPPLMLSVSVALGIDYCMFLLVRFQEAFYKYGNTDSAIELMLKSAGHVIIVSGSTLLCCFLMALMLPVDVTMSAALGCSAVTLFSMLVSFTLIPALLFFLGEKLLRYDQSIKTAFGRAFPCSSFHQQERQRTLGDEEKEDMSNNMVQEEEEEQDDIKSYNRVWLKLGEVILVPRNGVLILIALLCGIIPFGIKVSHAKSSPDWRNDIPVHSQSYDTIDALGRSFHKEGLYMPNRILFVAKPEKLPNGILEAGAWSQMQDFLGEIIRDVPGSTVDDYGGALIMAGKPVSYAEVTAAQNPATPPTPELSALRYFLATQTTPDGRALYITMVAQASPYSEAGFRWIRTFRDHAASSSISQDFDVYLNGLGPETGDMVMELFNALPWVMGLTLAVVFVLLGLMLRSVIAPIRSVISMAYTLLFVYGFAVMVYQDGVLAKTGVEAFQPVGKLTWMAVAVTFSFMVGFSLDYDVFICSRILEYRLDGYDHHSSILKGLVGTGRIITYAGIIMSIAFSGLLFSSFVPLRQYAFFLISALLIDTFVVRTLITPICIYLCGDKYAWWPRRDTVVRPTKTFPPEPKLDCIDSPQKRIAVVAGQL